MESTTNIPSFTDSINSLQIIFLYNIIEQNTVLYNAGFSNNEELILEMEKLYDSIQSQDIKKEMLRPVSKAKENYINKHIPRTAMGIKEELNDFFVFGKRNLESIKEFLNVKDKHQFSMEISDLVSEKKINSEDEKILNKIYDYCLFAQYINKEYRDMKAYIDLQSEAKASYSALAKKTNLSPILKKYNIEYFVKG